MDEPTFTVVKQSEVVGELPDGSFGRLVRIVFRTAAGVLGSVDVPSSTYSRDTAVAAITERAKHLDDVQAL